MNKKEKDIITELENCPTSVLAWILGVSTHTIRDHVNRGTFKRIKHGRYNALECIPAFLKAHEMSSRTASQTATVNLLRERAKRLKLANEKAEADLISADQVRDFAQGVFDTLINSLEEAGRELKAICPLNQAAKIDASVANVKQRIVSSTKARPNFEIKTYR